MSKWNRPCRLKKVEVKIKLYDGIMPQKQHTGDAAFDLYVPRDTELKTGRQVIDLGFALSLAHGFAALVQPRSGFSSKGIEVWYKKDEGQGGSFASDPHYRLDADVIVGLVDENYRGHVGAIVNVKRPIAENERIVIGKGVRIAQLRIVEVPQAEFVEVEALDDTERKSGFGSTGT